jgi:hypothetical protein
MRDRGLCQHEAGIAGQDGDAAEHDHKRQARPGHEAQFLALDAGMDRLRDGTGDRDRGRQHYVVGEKVDHEKDDRRKEIAAEPDQDVSHPFGPL